MCLDRCAAAHATMRIGGRPANVLVRLILGLVGFGPWHTSSLPDDDPSLPELERRPTIVLAGQRPLVGLAGLEPAPSSLSETDGQAPCYPASSQAATIREHRRDGVNKVCCGAGPQQAARTDDPAQRAWPLQSPRGVTNVQPLLRPAVRAVRKCSQALPLTAGSDLLSSSWWSSRVSSQ